jgi:hypothetical protein
MCTTKLHSLITNLVERETLDWHADTKKTAVLSEDSVTYYSFTAAAGNDVLRGLTLFHNYIKLL